MAALLVLAVGLLPVVWFLSRAHRVAYRRAKIRAQSFPEDWRSTLKKRMPNFRALPADLQLQLKKHIQVFIAEKAFVGCDGLQMTDEIRVTIAAQACLLLLNRKTDYYPQLSQILVYPDAFVVNKTHTDSLGLVTEHKQVLSGESWQQGQVILSWRSAVEDAHTPDDGRNVVIHEFAHQLDQENGQANGAPILARSEHYQSWSAVLGAVFRELQEQANQRQHSLFNHYGATSPAEFFAVVSEVFFEQPLALSEQYPALYQQLSRFYRLEPLSWQ